MTIKTILIFSMVSVMTLVSCNNSGKADSQPPTSSETKKDTSSSTSKEIEMKSYLAMFEIPALDINRAINFYEELLNVKIEKMDVEGMKMGILPYEGQMVTGVIIQAEGYKPSADGVTIYLNAGEDLQVMLNRADKYGVKVLVPKTAHADGSGYFAVFLDSEGNKMALNSPK